MGEYLRNAWSGWLDFTDKGKLAALLLASAAYLLLGRKRKGPQGRLALYGSIQAALCICPVTAALLMKYQTLFYDYPWIWSAVPVTAMIALGGTLFLTEQWKSKKGYKAWLYNGALTLLCVGALALCGGLGEGQAHTREESWDREQAEAVLSGVRDVCGEDICLWAPREILEYARVRDGAPRLFYGRNMWDAALNAYSYDVYPEEVQKLYLWMEQLTDDDAEFSPKEGQEYVQRAFAAGADCILLPGDIKGWEPMDEGRGQEALFGEKVETIRLDGYYLLRMR